MFDIEGVRAQVQEIMSRFPSVTATMKRPTVNAYGERSGTFTVLGTVTGWWAQPDPKNYRTETEGATYDEGDAQWMCAMWTKKLPTLQHGDIVSVSGVDYIVMNRINKANIRVFWQLRKQ